MSSRRLAAIVAHPEAAIRDSLARILSKVEGWRVYYVSNGGEAVRIALVTLPQLVLLDPHLQGMNGAATIASLRAHGITCPVVALVQHSGVADAQWEMQGYAGTVALSDAPAQLLHQLQALLDLRAP